MSALLAAQGGANVIYGAGMLENGICVDLAKMILDCEVFRMIKMTIGGISVTDENMAVDIIKQVGVGGEFLTHEHTLRFCRTAHSQSELFDRQTREAWIVDGKRDIVEKAYEKALDILNNHNPDPLPDEVVAELRAIVERAELEYGLEM